jgi:hypothetical protein
MEIVSLSSTTFIGLSTIYPFDPTLKYKENIIFTEDGLEFPQVGSLNELNDVTINNFSTLYLTNQQTLTSNLYIDSLEPLPDEGFSTFLAANAINSITPFSKYWVVEEPSNPEGTARLALTGQQALMDNRYFFDIYFIDEKLCYIAHENNKNIWYLTVDYLGELLFAPWGNYNYLGDASPQIFYYIYDRESDFIVFYKNASDISKYLAYNAANNDILLVDPVTATETPYPSLAIFRCQTRNEAPNKTKLFDPWVSYEKNFKTNTLDINENIAPPLVNSNFLINAQYYNITGNDINTNILSLKNTNTPENYQSRNNPFQIDKKPGLFVENETNFRDYKKIFSGSNQLLGDDNITIGYQSFTTDIVLKKDSITYFHMPQNIYPFIQINIAESGLTKAGAIAGDHPLKSDKIFKKLGNYKYTSQFGETIDEATGSFLCSWLSGNPDVTKEPIWVDRYYNPTKISFFSALTTNPIQSIEYKTVFDCLVDEVGALLKDVTVFDKPSDLIFEPGTYYAYHHYGPNDVKGYINSLQGYLIQKGFTIYKNLDGTNAVLDSNIEEITFDGSTYAETVSLSSIQESGQFTLSFFLHSYDWSKPFAGQLIGNFASDGFGIFNQNTITPTAYVATASGFEIFNTDYTNIKTLPYDSPPQAIIRPDGISNYYVIHKDGYWRKYNASDSLVQEVFNTALTEILWYDTTETIAYILCKVPGSRKIIKVDMRTGELQDITTSITLPSTISLNIRAALDPQQGWNSGSGLLTLFRQSSTVDFYDEKFYITPGSISTRVGETIFYLKDDNTIMRWDEIDRSTPLPATTAFKSYTNINDFELDYDNNIWILADDHKYFKYTIDRKFILSGTFAEKQLDGTLKYDQYKNFNVGFIADFENGNYFERVVITRVGRESLPTPAGYLYLSALSAEYYDFKILSKDGEPLESIKFKALSSTCIFDPTNTDWLRRFVKQTYPNACLNAKAVVSNVFDINDTYKINLIYDLSAVDPGYHHFAVRFDSYNGLMYLFVDGQEVKKAEFPPRKYKFSQFVTRPFLIGTSTFTNSVPLYQYLKKNSCLAADITMKNLYLSDIPFNYFDLAFLTREGMEINDIHFNVPCGQRNYLEEIERYFKATVPGRKSEFYNIKIKNTNITDPILRNTLEKRILEILRQSSPAYSQLNTIKWE